ncbi:hypothetical protein Ade02nite_20530 [Paractinoplanes deccanensis]|uniref:Uncharacterized protein n=1 Tax=Paractinoplanes deccanensis TaxID=113561 RepID=A0ABQ3Y083_9ACTN|nr:hypothetical protein [Actinoplanes deccanensis]GID73412.1 hypothetical protein Ade02nite_20530 [Actinoplanes deccanensis]
MITEHAVCALPPDHRSWRHLVIRVERIDATEEWRVRWGAEYLTSGADWSPDARDAEQFTEQDALDVAEVMSRHVDVDGLTAADLLNR